ncbi:MAG: hypothetical protein V3S33_02930 [Gammaproteobacteria bacterium]
MATHLIRKIGYTAASARAGAVTLIQRFGGALDLNVHLSGDQVSLRLQKNQQDIEDTLERWLSGRKRRF